MSCRGALFRYHQDHLLPKKIILNSQTLFQNKLFTRGPVYKKSTADIEEKIREINLAVEAKIEEQEKMLQEEPTVEKVEEVIDTLTNLAAIEVVAEEMAEAAIMAEEMAEVEEDIKEMVDLKVVDIGESVAEEIAEEIEEEIAEQVAEEELVEELVMEEMIKEAVIDEVEADAVEENIIESEVTTVDPTEEEVDFGDITEVAV